MGNAFSFLHFRFLLNAEKEVRCNFRSLFFVFSPEWTGGWVHYTIGKARLYLSKSGLAIKGGKSKNGFNWSNIWNFDIRWRCDHFVRKHVAPSSVKIWTIVSIRFITSPQKENKTLDPNPSTHWKRDDLAAHRRFHIKSIRHKIPQKVWHLYKIFLLSAILDIHSM